MKRRTQRDVAPKPDLYQGPTSWEHIRAVLICFLVGVPLIGLVVLVLAVKMDALHG